MQFLDALKWRYATKVFDPAKKVLEEKLKELLEAARLAPNSFGLDAWAFVVVENPELRAKLREASWGQAQVTDASHLVVFCRQKELTVKDGEAMIALTAETRGVDPATLDGYKQMVIGSIAGRDEVSNATWMAKQVYLALGVFLSACALEGIDAGPMEGFDPAKYDEILDLEAKGLKSVVICAVGYRGDDKYASAKKVRKAAENIIVRI
ncbi:NAD(P)H-dependent oxidoreductase [Candidatus Peregrinibacteria bacterium]|nr:MAG: NAD(P)H-dependent oxidoreductase [Candidatus Peregrinibacteria bacterium]